MYVMVCYDVVSNRKRAKLLKSLKGYLDHVQKSVFEGELDAARCDRMKEKILTIIDPEWDTVRVYHLCKRCRPRTEILGTGVVPESGPDVIV